MSDFVQLSNGVPERIALAYNDGRDTQTSYGPKVFFTLTDGRVLSTIPGDAAKIRALGLERGEPFNICRNESFRGRKKVYELEVWRDDPQPQEEPHYEPDDTDTGYERTMRASLAQHGVNVPAPRGRQAQRPAPPQQHTAPQPVPRNGGNPNAGAGNGGAGNGRNGGNGGRPYEAAGIPAPPVKIPFEAAVRQGARLINEVLKDVGWEWGDQARQDLLSTFLIEMGRSGWLAAPRWDK